MRTRSGTLGVEGAAGARAGRRGVASVPVGWLLRLQSQAGNRATTQVVRNLRQRLLQRVGEKKLGYTKAEGATDDVDVLLGKAFAEVREKRAAAKNAKEKELATYIKGAKERAKAEKEKEPEKKEKQPAKGVRAPVDPNVAAAQTIVLDWYPQELTALAGDPVAALAASGPFREGPLKLGLLDPKTDLIAVYKDGKVVAQITVGATTFVAAGQPAGATARPTFTKLRGSTAQGEYVKDDRGVATRRYAYCEKSIYQFMELVLTGQMTGRYQLLHEAVGKPTRVDEAAPDIVKKVSGDEREARGRLEREQLAFLHQWMGSGNQQRGLSLTSTPRLGAVYSNDADPFKEDDGVRIKIDLAKVPGGVVLLNHYAASGVKDTLTGVDPKRYQQGPDDPSPDKYAYKGSVQKNRELFLERLVPEWVSEVTFHAGENKAPKVVKAEGTKTVDEDPYVQRLATAYAAGFAGTAPPVGSDAAMAGKGAGSRTLYDRGYLTGQREWTAYREAYARAQLQVWEVLGGIQETTLPERQTAVDAAKTKRRKAQLEAQLERAGEKAEEVKKRLNETWAKEDADAAKAGPESAWELRKQLDAAKPAIKTLKTELSGAIPAPARLAIVSVYDAVLGATHAEVKSVLTRQPHQEPWDVLEALAIPPKVKSGVQAKREPPIFWLGWAHGAAGAQRAAAMDRELYRHRPLPARPVGLPPDPSEKH